MAKENLDTGKSISLAILGIVAVIAIVGLVLLFSGAKSATGKAGVEQPYAKLIGGKDVDMYKCPETCQVRGMRTSVTCTVDSKLAGKSVAKEFRACPGTLETEQGCDCDPERRAWT